MLRTIFHRRFTSKLHYFYWQPLACVCYPQKHRLLCFDPTCQFLKLHSNFRIDNPSPAGPCGSSVRIISGEEEGLFGWISVNYLLDGFGSSSSDRSTYGFLDMGAGVALPKKKVVTNSDSRLVKSRRAREDPEPDGCTTAFDERRRD